MTYILQYFDELLEDLSQREYDITNSAKVGREDLEKEILINSKQVQNQIKDIFYSDKTDSQLSTYFNKMVKRLVQYKHLLEAHIHWYEQTLVLRSHPVSLNVKLKNCYSIYNHFVQRILNVILKEFEFAGNLSLPDLDKKVIEKTVWELHCDHEVVRNSICKEGQIDSEILKKYNIQVDKDGIFALKGWYSVCNTFSLQYSFLNDISPDSMDSTFFDDIEEFIGEYIFAKKSYERRFYLSVAQRIKNEIKEKQSEKEIEDYIIDFMVFNNLCHREIMTYFKREIVKQLFSNDSNQIHEYIQIQINRLENIANSTGIPTYNWRFVNTNGNHLIQKLQLLFKDNLLKINEAKPKLEQIDFEGEKLTYKDNAESLSLLFWLMCEVGLFDENNKSKIGRVLSKSIITVNKEDDLTPRTIADFMNPKNRGYDHKNIPFLKRNLQKIISKLNDVKIKKQLN